MSDYLDDVSTTFPGQGLHVQDKIGYLHDNIGKNYLEKIIKPAVRSVTREVILSLIHI